MCYYVNVKKSTMINLLIQGAELIHPRSLFMQSFGRDTLAHLLYDGCDRGRG